MPSSVLSSDFSLLSFSVVGAILAAAFPLFKLLSFLHFEKHKINLKKLEIVNSVLSKNPKNPSIKQRYLVEKIFSSIYKCELSYEEIYGLLKFENPSKAFDLYPKARKCLELSKKKNSFRLNRSYRKFKFIKLSIYPYNIYQFSRYFLFGFLGTVIFLHAFQVLLDSSIDDRMINGLFQPSWLSLPVWFWIFSIVAAGIVLWVYAIRSLFTIGCVDNAFLLVGMYKNHLTDN
ncbi:hypothetical protein CXF83_14855 [Shewanella sp. Choline-02u-19]|uniref:hypothetical protein n=1 Tax=unclassified Shewanella TaxID=196818 RepID=UPI000C326200|nr:MULTISPECIES: hypothetical protein [unclassified Shewanella]PKH57102.1 hypothetical protein CXF84_11565 [Shewanella sp. Bg11-22]PKI27899.1 hypothetical protein CXF83_14855 [Shewanella sp. Choline-02u-19]